MVQNSLCLPCEVKHKLAYFPYKVISKNIQQFFPLLKENNLLIFANEIIINSTIIWNSPYNFTLLSEWNVIFGSKANILSNGGGSLIVKSGFGIDGSAEGKVLFDEGAKITFNNGGEFIIHYNPNTGEDGSHKYTHPMGNYAQYVSPILAVKPYMMVNDVNDLQNIRVFLHGNYALSKDIDASATINWNEGKGFAPILFLNEKIPFTGNFDGNNFSIRGLFISRNDESRVGLFGDIAGNKGSYKKIENLFLTNSSITGDHYVGGLVGTGEYFSLENIYIKDTSITGKSVVGGMAGSIRRVSIDSIEVDSSVQVQSNEYGGRYFGAIEETELSELCIECSGELEYMCLGASRDVYFDCAR